VPQLPEISDAAASVVEANADERSTEVGYWAQLQTRRYSSGARGCSGSWVLEALFNFILIQKLRLLLLSIRKLVLKSLMKSLDALL